MDTAERLLDAHIAFVLDQLTGERFSAFVEAEVEQLLLRAEHVQLEHVVDRADVTAVATKYAAQFELPGAIPEVAGDVAARVRAHPANDTTLGDLVPRRHVEAAAEKIAELRPLRMRIAEAVSTSPVVQAWLANYLLGLATGAIAANRRMAEKLPGVSRMFAAGEKLGGGVLREADQRSRELAERTAANLLQQWTTNAADSFGDAEFAEAIMDAWDRVAPSPMADLVDATGEDDLIDFIAIGYEAWLDLRTSDYLAGLIATGVDYFFDTYGGYTLAELLAEFGLGHDDLVTEALRFAPRALDALRGSGELERFVRRQLAAFYESPEVAAILAP